jgi:hypothetical protein
MRHPIQLPNYMQRLGLPHGILHVFNTTLYEIFYGYPRNYLSCLTLLRPLFYLRRTFRFN